jgi:RNA polymerase sigma-70 factor (ECF subfamily)
MSTFLIDKPEPRRPHATGDLEEFEALARGHQRALYAYAYRMLRSQADAEDCVQDALLAAWRSRAGFRGGYVLPWLLRITHHKVIDHVRRRREAEPFDEERSEVVGTDGPAAVAQRLDTTRALAALRDEFREVVVMRLVLDLSEAECADILDVPLGTVKTRLHRARRDLAALMSAG